MSEDPTSPMPLELSDEDHRLVDIIADRAAKKAVIMMQNEFYRTVGRTVVQRVLTVIGILVAGMILHSKINLPDFLK